MSLMLRKIMAACSSKRQNKQTMDIEMEDCASYESFCYAISATKKSRYSSYISDDYDSDSNAVDWEHDNGEESDDDMYWTNYEPWENEQTKNDFEIVFEEQSEMDEYHLKVNKFWNQPYESNKECGRSLGQIREENNCDIDRSSYEHSSRDKATVEFEIYLDERIKKRGVLQKLNRDWSEAYQAINENERSTTKVSFAPDDSLVEVLPADEFDRKGEWMMYAIDRLRFKKRIEETESILSPIFSEENRSKAMFELQINVEQTFCADSK